MQGQTLIDRYQIGELLGTGGSGSTYRGLDLDRQQPVAVKILSLQRASDWKALELFEREAKTLAQLDRPDIPQYIDFFETAIGGEQTFCIIQQLAPGRTLHEWRQTGYLFTHAEVKQIAERVLDILIYLQSLSPPIIHRDLKPQNILRDDAGNIYLVDFGTVRDSYHHTITGGSTIVGTYGYMAPEQFRGQAVLATDLYGLGATLVYLLTGIDPADLPQQDLRLDIRSQVRLDADFSSWLERMLEPIAEDRFRDARQARHYLVDNRTEVSNNSRPHQPLSRASDDGLSFRVSIPAVGLNSKVSQRSLLNMLLPIGLILAFEWGLYETAMPTDNDYESLWMLAILFGLILLPVLLILTIRLGFYLRAIFIRYEITLDRIHLKISRFLGDREILTQLLFVESIETIAVKRSQRLSLKQAICITLAGANRWYEVKPFGHLLDADEKSWLVRELIDRVGRG
jgi:eukaryotic-like serine/threonine-protein kinase